MYQQRFQIPSPTQVSLNVHKRLRPQTPCLACCFAAVLLLVAGCNRSNVEPQKSETNFQPAKQDAAANEKTETQDASLAEQAYREHRLGNSQRAMRLVQQSLIQDPTDIATLRLAVELYSQSADYCLAAEFASKLADLDSQNSDKIRLRVFDWYIKCGNFAAAEQNLKDGLAVDPNNVNFNRLLAQLLNAQGRRFEASEYARELIRLRAVNPAEVLSLIDLSGPYYLASFDEFISLDKPSLFQLGKLREQYTKLNVDPDRILQKLRELREAFPDNAALAAFQGRVLTESAHFDELAQWLDALPENTSEQPEYWSTIGNWLVHRGEDRSAIRAFGESLRRDPTDRESLRQLLQVLTRLDLDTQAEKARQNLVTLDRIFRIAKQADPDQMRWIAEQLQQLTRPWESIGWLIYDAQVTGQMALRIPQIGKRADAVKQWESAASEEQLRSVRLNSLLGFNINEIPLPNLKGVTDSTQTPSGDNTANQASEGRRIDFADIASQCGIQMTFESGFPHDGMGFHPYQVNGGGIAVIDFDLDGWNDLYFANAGDDPRNDNASQPNRLYRSQHDEQFQDVSEMAGVTSRHFGQGVAAGDLNQDGFLDLVVGNIGRNDIYLNQGDGTFLELAADKIDDQSAWTSCVGIADVTGDHLPEIIEVNYIDDPKSFDARCEEDYLTCQPQRFNAAADRVFVNQGQGHFTAWDQFDAHRDVRQHGFGLVIANFDRKLGNDFFVANDGDLNHYWVSVPNERTDTSPYELAESASIRGCSIGRGGNSQACMGVASGDLDRNGTLDLLITNFHNEPVNLFLQSRSGFFADESVRYGLFEPTYSVLGFGTQSSDFDNDGWPDLAALSGHVFNATAEGVPFRMKPQLFRGSSNGFALQNDEDLSDYWQQEQLGRTLAVLDLQHDGQIDLVSSHLDLPIALLKNRSDSGHWFQLELIGVESERDAIGAEISVRSGTQTWHAWQTGGDGYMCSNEPVLHIGLGSATRIDEVKIDWPSGKTQSFSDIDADQRYLLIEGDDQLAPRW